MKKLLNLTGLLITLVVIALSLSGCGGNQNQQSSVPTQNSGDNDTTSSSEPEVIVPEKLNDAEIIGPNDTELEMSEYPDIKHMPSVMPNLDDYTYWKVGDYGYEPRVIKEIETEEYYVTISVPELSEKIKKFIQGRGEAYLLIHSTYKSDTSKSFASLIVYDKETLIEYFPYYKVVSGFCPRYVFTAGDNLFTGFPSIVNSCFVFHEATIPEVYYYLIETETGEGAIFTPDKYTTMSYSPTDDKVDLMIQYVEPIDWQ